MRRISTCLSSAQLETGTRKTNPKNYAKYFDDFPTAAAFILASTWMPEAHLKKGVIKIITTETRGCKAKMARWHAATPSLEGVARG